MASKPHADNTVNERRLRPIYDWLDNGNNKKAVQEAAKVLKKQPNNQCARVLKALALLRLGKEDECQTIVGEVRSEVPCEDAILQAMSIIYREIHQPDKISEVYEAAAQADPKNEELLTHLFMSYVRIGDYKKQQKTALALYKLKPKNPYYFWAVMSIVMQAIHLDGELSKEVILPLAERMVLRLVKGEKIEAEPEVQLYLMILELQGKSEEMLNVLSGPLGSYISSVPERKAALLLKLERFSEAADAYKELINEDVDNWAHYPNYLSAALKCQMPEKCLAFLNEIIKTCGKKVRAPYLARFEILKHTRNSAKDEKSSDRVDWMHQYFLQFGEKGSVVGDLRLYLNLLTPEEKSELLKKIDEEVGVEPDGFPQTVEQMQKHIHLEQMRRICGFHHAPLLDIEGQKQLVGRLYGLYEMGNILCPVKQRLPTDFCPADAYMLLAIHLVHQLWHQTGEASYVCGAMTMLEHALLASPANFHIKILLVRTYLEVGLIGSADHVFTLLDVKHIQLDSLGYLHAPLLAPLGHISLASKTVDHTAKFFVANSKDSADHLTFVYKYGSFEKIQEFEELRQRLENSIHFATTTVDKMLLELTWCNSPTALLSSLNSMHIQPQEDSIRWEALRDNRDLDVIRGWDPLPENGEDPRMQEETRICMVRLLAARNLMLRIVAATAEPDDSELLARLSAELKHLDSEQIPQILGKFEPKGRKNAPCKLLVPMDAVERLREAHYSEQLKTIATVAKSLSNSYYPDAECIEMLRKSPCLRAIELPDGTSPISFKYFFLRASTCSETLAIVASLFVMRARQQEPTPSKSKNQQKKGKRNNVTAPVKIQPRWKDIGDILYEKVIELDMILVWCHYEMRNAETKYEDIVRHPRRHNSIEQSCRCLKTRSARVLRVLDSLLS